MGLEISNLVIVGIKVSEEDLVDEMGFDDSNGLHEWMSDNNLRYDPRDENDVVFAEHMESGMIYIGVPIDKQFGETETFSGIDLIDDMRKHEMKVSEYARNLGIKSGELSIYSICSIH